MSRIGKASIKVPLNVKVDIQDSFIKIIGNKGVLIQQLSNFIKISFNNGFLNLTSAKKEEKNSWTYVGTMRALINNMIIGVSAGFEKKLLLVGVGYRAQVKDNFLILSLGFSHQVNYTIPSGIIIETPVPTEIIIRGFDKQKVGQVASEIRAYRPPEPYKGKGVRYADEQVLRKEAKKK